MSGNFDLVFTGNGFFIFLLSIYTIHVGGGGGVMKTKMHVTTGDKRLLSHSYQMKFVCEKSVILQLPV